jgi:hypothetical protein
MRIIGGHDYWDSAAAYGVDETVTLVRNTAASTPDKTVDTFELPTVEVWGEGMKDRDCRRGRGATIYTGAILVAGKAYPFWTAKGLNHCDLSFSGYYDVPLAPCFYDVESLEAAYPDIKNDRNFYYLTPTYKKWLERFQSQAAFKDDAVVNFLLENDAAFAIVVPAERNRGFSDHAQKSNVYFNTSHLQHFNFFQVMDPFTMHMTVANWVSGVLSSTDKTEKLSDKSKILKAGFDYKTSFRNMK